MRDCSHHTDDSGCGLSSELIRAASAGVDGAKITMPRSGRPSTAKLERYQPGLFHGARTIIAYGARVVGSSNSARVTNPRRS
jgi:hypothetical protein